MFIDENLCGSFEENVPNGLWSTLMCNEGDGVEGKNIRIEHKDLGEVLSLCGIKIFGYQLDVPIVQNLQIGHQTAIDIDIYGSMYIVNTFGFLHY